ncbi:MAG TPA: glycosyltransferase [Ktedonobacteraceae bacterium]
MIEASEVHHSVQQTLDGIQNSKGQHLPLWKRWPGQFVRFGIVGGLNTSLDLLILNGLLWLFPTTSTILILLFNSLAYGLGAVNSFLFNKYWTFAQRQRITWSEVRRFAVTTLLGIGCNDMLIWCANNLFHPLITNTALWMNASKIVAIAGTVFVSYLGMRLWVFVNQSQEEDAPMKLSYQSNMNALGGPMKSLLAYQKTDASGKSISGYTVENRDLFSLSVVLPAYNEEQIIAHTVSGILDILKMWMKDFEVIVVNDGSTDQTASIVAAMGEKDSHVHLITHPINQGYGAALVSGFASATKERTFFMDSDGQFDIRDLATFFPFVAAYDAVIGYRIDRQDTWVRKLNAWGWKQVIGFVLNVHVRDIDCAFKLISTEFLHTYPLETRGAMINAELLYKLKQAGCTYKEVGVRHLPRRSGQATGANPAVIARAFRELLVSAHKWKQEQYKSVQKVGSWR